MSKLWLQGGKLVANAQGVPIICDDCPCEPEGVFSECCPDDPIPFSLKWTVSGTCECPDGEYFTEHLGHEISCVTADGVTHKMQLVCGLSAEWVIIYTRSKGFDALQTTETADTVNCNVGEFELTFSFTGGGFPFGPTCTYNVVIEAG